MGFCSDNKKICDLLQLHKEDIKLSKMPSVSYYFSGNFESSCWPQQLKIKQKCHVQGFIEGLITEYQCVTVSYGISCSFWVIITHECE